MGRLQDKSAIITGGGSGLGRAAALLFAAEGAKVVIADIDADRGENVVGEVRAQGGQAVFVKTDVSRSSDLARMVGAAVESFGGLNILVNNAGIWIPRSPEELSEDEWQRILDINLKSVWLGCKHAIPELRKAGGGAIVNTASVAGMIAYPACIAYGASKAGVISLTKTMAHALAKDQIRVNCVCPGSTETNIFQGHRSIEELREQMRRILPLRRIGQPEDIAEAMVYLASDAASWVTGVQLPVDGGYLLRL